MKCIHCNDFFIRTAFNSKSNACEACEGFSEADYYEYEEYDDEVNQLRNELRSKVKSNIDEEQRESYGAFD